MKLSPLTATPEATSLANYRDMSGFSVCAVDIIEALQMKRFEKHRHLSMSNLPFVTSYICIMLHPLCNMIHIMYHVTKGMYMIYRYIYTSEHSLKQLSLRLKTLEGQQYW